MADNGLIIHVKDRTFETKLNGQEKRDVKRLIRAELADDGDYNAPTCLECGSHKIAHVFNWGLVDDDAFLAATATILMQREDPSFTLEDALAFTDDELYYDDEDEDDGDPPTEEAEAVAPAKPKPSSRASASKKTRAVAGSQS
jgi:hypothetical protein